MRSAFAALFVMLLAAAGASASLPTSALTGRVTAGDAPAEGVTVTLTSTALQQPRTTATGPRGTYWAAALPPGVYDVTFSRTGMTTLTRRAVVELGRVARADARLEPSEEEDSVTSTATTISVGDTTPVTTHFTETELDRLPTGRDVAPLAPGANNEEVLLDGAFRSSPAFLGEELVHEVTVFRGGLPVDEKLPAVVHASTRSGGEELFLSLRATHASVSGDDGLLLESASGGRIIRERLWFFGAGWSGDRPMTSHGTRNLRGLLFKLTAQPFAAHSVSAMYLDAEESDVALMHTGTYGARATTELRLNDRSTLGKATYFLPTARGGDHVLTAGAGDSALFVNDRWSRGHWTLSAGLRHEDNDTLPRLALAYDVHQDGRRAVIATHGEYGATRVEPSIRLTTLGYAAAIGTSGTARADLVRRGDVDELQMEARYSLFGRLDTGASLTLSDEEHRGAAWAGAQLPAGNHEAGFTLLESYEEAEGWRTGLALRYAIPISRIRLTLAADGFTGPRVVRFWARVRM
ncbi:MAG TPA: carboxypeptidase-like regulatory domain-containing protein [Thermoanaerobaculia bacterium]|nr:carboxypeptidase-like regulatory domain-containing protein [Thermoanaerobaculia bacterium]